MSEVNVNAKGVVLPPKNESEVEKEMEQKRQEEIEERNDAIEEIKEKAAKIKIEGTLEELMTKHEIPTPVSLARAVNIAPQQLYSRRKQLEDGTKVLNFEAVERTLMNAALKNTEFTTIEEVVLEARAYLDAKAANKKEKSETKKKEKEEAPVVEFKVGDAVEYDTYRANDGVREYYTRKGIIESLSNSGHKAKIKTDDGGDVEITVKKIRLQVEEVVVETGTLEG